MKKVMLILLINIFFVDFAVSKKLIVGVDQIQRYPFYFINKNNKYDGMIVRIAEIIFKKLGHQLIYRSMPWNNILDGLNTGEIDLTLYLFEISERAKYILYASIPFVYESVNVFQRSDKDIIYKGQIIDFLGYRVGVSEGFKYERHFDLASFINKVTLQNEDEIIEELVNKKTIDIGVGNKYVISEKLKKKNILNKVSFSNAVLNVEGLYIGLSRKRKDAHTLVSNITMEIANLKQTPKYQEILKKFNYLGQ